MTRSFTQVAAALWLAAASTHSLAADFSFSGHIEFNNDVVQVAFDISEPLSDLRLWTDSWASGLNFDPGTTLWQRVGADHQLTAQNDDDDTVAAGQGAFDSGLSLQGLAAGSYIVTLTAFPYQAAGSLLSQGFAFDTAVDPAPVITRIADWNQPGYDANANDQKGTFWRLNLSGVSQAAVVPEPQSWALMAAGLAMLLTVARLRG